MDVELADRIFWNIAQRLDNSDAADDLPPKCRAACLVWGATTLTDNGGFAYFYENRSDAAAVADAFTELGLTQQATAFRESMAVFPNGTPPASDTERARWMHDHEEAIDAVFDRLDRPLPTLLDDDYYELLFSFLERSVPELVQRFGGQP
jgi:hypothetical protein